MGRSRRNIAETPVPDRIVIPDLEGTIVAGALRQSELIGFTLVIADPPVDLGTLQMSGRWLVSFQEPPAGSARFRGDTVVVTLRRDGGDGAGDREPRLPRPPRLAARPPLDEQADDEALSSGRRPGRKQVGQPDDATVLRFQRPAGRRP
jgi:hypothetical protein